jgi:chromosome segregation ATPase
MVRTLESPKRKKKKVRYRYERRQQRARDPTANGPVSAPIVYTRDSYITYGATNMSARNDMTNYDENDGSRPQSALESLEQQRIAEVFRAQSKLLGMKAFRVNNEKFYKDKELSEIRKKEIAEPLEEALTTIEVLQEKVSRRDAMISKLQKFITVDLLKGQQQEDLRAKVLEINQVDEQNQVVLMDTIRELQRVIEVQANQITRCKDTIAHQKECNKQAVRNIDMQEFSHKELIRQIENDKDSYVRQADVKEKRIQELLLAKQTLEKRVERFDEENKETVQALKEAQNCVRELQEAAHQAQSEFDELQARYSATEFALLEAREHLVELRERHVSLRTRLVVFYP